MPHPAIKEGTQPCIWMTAGLITYKLCDRDFECERCPLDAGLRGNAFDRFQPRSVLVPAGGSRVFPDDRLYATGHTWLQAVGGRDDRRWRFGLDAFAAACVGQCDELRRCDAGSTLEKGEIVCQIDLGIGVLSVGAVTHGVVAMTNPTLEVSPNLVITAPYEDGWIAELATDGANDMGGLVTAELARENARLDLQRLRRRVAMQLLADSTATGQTAADGGELIVDLRQMLGGSAYLSLLRELIH